MKRLLPLLIAVTVLAGTAAAVSFAVGGDSGGSPKNAGRQTTGDEAQPGVAAMCVEGVPDCNDMVVEPDGAGTEPCAGTLEAECDTVDGSPPIRSDEGVDPNECSLVHHIDACSPEDIARISGGVTAFDITIPFNASMTEEDTKIVLETVLGFDSNADVLVLESFPPIGRVRATSVDPGFCAAIESKLEGIPAVGDVACAVAPVDPENQPGPDEPVSSEPGSSPSSGPKPE